jgi:hypothetical protein
VAYDRDGGTAWPRSRQARSLAPKGPRVFARHGPEFKAIGAPASNVPPMLLARAGGTVAWPHAAVRHHRAQSPQYLSKQTSGGTIDEALACQERKCFVSSGEGVSYSCIFFSRI